MQVPDGDGLSGLATTIVIDRARRGDRGALDALVERIYPRIVELVQRQKKGRVLNEGLETMDLAQEVALDLSRDLPSVRASNSATFDAYVRRVVRSVTCSNYRRLRAKRRDMLRVLRIDCDLPIDLEEFANSSSTPSHHASNNEFRARVAALLPLLGAENEEIYIRVRWLQESAKAVGADFGESDAWARMRAKRAEAQLTSLLNEARRGHLLRFIDRREREDDDEAAHRDARG